MSYIDEMIRVDLPQLIHEILLKSNMEHKELVDINLITMRKVIDSEIENTLKELQEINNYSKEQDYIDKLTI